MADIVKIVCKRRKIKNQKKERLNKCNFAFRRIDEMATKDAVDVRAITRGPAGARRPETTDADAGPSRAHRSPIDRARTPVDDRTPRAISFLSGGREGTGGGRRRSSITGANTVKSNPSVGARGPDIINRKRRPAAICVSARKILRRVSGGVTPFNGVPYAAAGGSSGP